MESGSNFGHFIPYITFFPLGSPRPDHVSSRSAPLFGHWAQGRTNERTNEQVSLKECKMLMSDDDDGWLHRALGRSSRRPRPSLTHSLCGEIIVASGVASQPVMCIPSHLPVTIRTTVQQEGRVSVQCVQSAASQFNCRGAALSFNVIFSFK